MSLRDDIKDELAAAYALGIAEGERRALNRLVPEDISLNLFPRQGEQHNSCNKGKAATVGGGCPPVSPAPHNRSIVEQINRRANI
jgi:hypothetical protein